MAKKDGRPQKYSQIQLNEILDKYIDRHPSEKIRYKTLVDETGIPRHIWNGRCKSQIDEYNNQLNYIQGRSAETLFPTPEMLGKLYEQDKSEFYKRIDMILKLAIDVENYRTGKAIVDDEKEQLKYDLRMANLKLKKQEDINKKLEQLLNNHILHSKETEYREENNIQKDIITMNPENIATFEDFLKDIKSM